MPPPLLTYGFDIETDTAVDGLDPTVAAIVAIALTGDDLEIVLDGDERMMIADLDRVLTELPAGVLVTWNGGGFDLPFLRYRADLLGLRLGLDLRRDLAGIHRARWHGHRHVDGYQLFRADVGASLRLPCGLKPLARFVGLPVIEVDRERIHELTPAERGAYVASDARLARALVARRPHWAAGIDQVPSGT